MTRGRSGAWLALLTTIVVGAVLQALTAVPGYEGTDTETFWWAAAGSSALLWLQLVLITLAAMAIAASPATTSTVVVWSGIVLAAGALVAVVVPLALPAVAVVAPCLLAAAGAGSRNAFEGFGAFRRRPGPSIAAVAATLALSVATWAIAFANGLLLGQMPGSIATWVWAGAVTGLLVAWWARLQRPASASPRTPRRSAARPR